MRFLSLFSGIGGLDLGLERAGMTCVGQVEIDPYCRAVLEKHWPGVKRMNDVLEVKGDEFGEVDLVCGGVPCQPASCAGKRKGATDERWLWGEFVRVVRAVRPAWVLAENVRGFLSLADSARVFDDLESAGYEVGTVVLGAHHVGAPHKRDRVWIVGHAASKGYQGRRRECESGKGSGEVQVVGTSSRRAAMAHAGNWRVDQRTRTEGRQAGQWIAERGIAGSNGENASAAIRGLADPEQSRRGTGSGEQGDEGRAGSGRGQPARGVQLADANGRRSGQDRRSSELWASGIEQPPGNSRGNHASEGQEINRWPARPGERQHEWEAPRLVYATGSRRTGTGAPGASGAVRNGTRGAKPERRRGAGSEAIGLAEPSVGIATPGLPRRLAGLARRSALRALGNAVVPQVAEVIARAMMEAGRAE